MTKKKLLLLAVFIILLSGYVFISNKILSKPMAVSDVHYVTLGGATLMVDVVATPEARTQGLSGRPSLSADQGMLFVFDHPDTYGFWMKDMNFSIDMIWIDEHQNVVYIKENATPDSYPTAFAPTSPALYVLETVAGFSENHALKAGDKVKFSTYASVTPTPQPPVENPTSPQSPATAGKCYVGGCSAEVCSDQIDVTSSCIYKPEFACYKSATCERQSNGQCGWTQTPSLQACIKANINTQPDAQ